MSSMGGPWPKMESSHVGPESNFFFVKAPKHVLSLYGWDGVVGDVKSMIVVFVMMHCLKLEYGE